MSEIITISHAEFTARQTTYDAIKNANFHVTWVPEFVDLALSSFPGHMLADLVSNPAFLNGCAAILTTNYKQPGVEVTAETSAEAGRSLHLNFLNPYATREVGRCLRKARLEVRVSAAC